MKEENIRAIYPSSLKSRRHGARLTNLFCFLYLMGIAHGLIDDPVSQRTSIKSYSNNTNLMF